MELEGLWPRFPNVWSVLWSQSYPKIGL
ncbi:hypothetical protein E2C01_098338 [Portunus trituberculatus]|uniref:Uncharacterized protein n=1 Tax=Portunus trituberculatus TaxID=210409 RepID=A0A5B7KBV4_PORTR|nr:hypothetical protein [Portunus trituberculatus]